MLEFTRALYELFIKQGLSLSQSLLIMKSKPKVDDVRRAADFLYTSLENGSLFSNALKSCRAICFNDVYISFVSIAEKNGDLKTTLTYLLQKLERDAESRKKLAAVSVYPSFVVILSVAASIFVGLYTDTADFPLLLKYVSVLIFVCGLLFYAIVKTLGENRLFEAFTAVDFLLSNGIELDEAVGCAIQIAGPSSKTGKVFENAKTRLSYGMDLQTAFSLSDSKMKEAFYYADIGGSKDDLFGRIAAYLKSEKERKREICMALIEPLFIVVTGILILAILMSFFMPLINGTGWI